ASVPRAGALGRYRAVVQLNALSDERQADAESVVPVRVVHLLEHVEDALNPLRRNADSGIAHDDDNLVVLLPHGQPDRTAVGCELRGVRQQVRKHLGEPVWVALDPQRRPGKSYMQLVALRVEQRLAGFERSV